MFPIAMLNGPVDQMHCFILTVQLYAHNDNLVQDGDARLLAKALVKNLLTW